jgi:hypothetical protein
VKTTNTIRKTSGLWVVTFIRAFQGLNHQIKNCPCPDLGQVGDSIDELQYGENKPGLMRITGLPGIGFSLPSHPTLIMADGARMFKDILHTSISICKGWECRS